MKKFKEYLSEEVVPQSLSNKEFIGIEDESVRDNINSLLNGVTNRPVVTPYISLERVRKVLSYYHIFLPAHQFMQGDCGNKVFNISQFGEKYGQTNDGKFVTKSDSPYSLYFEYQMNDSGLYDIYAEVVDDDELEEILSDFEDELSDDSGEEDDSEVVSNDQQNSYLLNKDEHKGNVQEDYEPKAAKDARELKKIAKRDRYMPRFSKSMSDLAKRREKKAVTGMDESILGDIATGVGMGAVGGMIGAGTGMVLHGKYGKKKKSVADRLMDTKHEKSFQKYKIKQSDSSLKRATKPKTIERLNKEKSDAQDKLKKTSYWKSLLPEEQMNESPDNEKTDHKAPGIKKLKDGSYWAKSQGGSMKVFKNEKSATQHSKKLDEETINEISRKLAKKAEHKAAKKYYDAYDAETDAREKVQKEKTPEARKGAEDAKAVKTKAAKRVIRFQNYADKKKLKEETINELSKGTLGSYIKKASQRAANNKAAAAGYAERSYHDYNNKNYKKGDMWDKKSQKADAKSEKRLAGISKATDRLTKEEAINEGRPSQRHPLEGHEYHRKSDAELIYIGKDAHKAAQAMKGHNEKAEGKYLDQANDAATVRHFRQRSGMPNWYKEKYGHNKK